MVKRLDLTTGTISRQLLKLSSPIMLGMLIFTFYLLSDLYFVSRLGPDAVAALSISGNIF
ncbi:MAG: MATE family efflux transporter, partial [Desulfobacula sp.]|nr:MATE family efflux transporter [Desulfobacula sp.]